MISPILQRGYKAELKRDIADVTDFGVDYWNVKGRFMSRESLRALLKAYRYIDDDGKAFKQWLLDHFPEAIDQQEKAEFELRKADSERTGEAFLDWLSEKPETSIWDPKFRDEQDEK